MANPNNSRPLMAEDGDTCEVCGAPSKRCLIAVGLPMGLAEPTGEPVGGDNWNIFELTVCVAVRNMAAELREARKGIAEADARKEESNASLRALCASLEARERELVAALDRALELCNVPERNWDDEHERECLRLAVIAHEAVTDQSPPVPDDRLDLWHAVNRYGIALERVTADPPEWRARSHSRAWEHGPTAEWAVRAVVQSLPR